MTYSSKHKAEVRVVFFTNEDAYEAKEFMLKLLEPYFHLLRDESEALDLWSDD